MTYVIGPDLRPTIPKDPDASLRYGVDITDVIAPGDEVQSVSISAQSGVTAADASAAGLVVSARVSGGTAGATGSVTLRWVTTGGDTDERTLWFAVQER